MINQVVPTYSDQWTFKGWFM